MLGKTHLIGGISSGVIYCSLLYPEFTPLFPGIILSSSIGSLMPDIDNKQSMISKRAKLTSTVVTNMFGHRKMTHAPLFVLLLYYIGTSLIDKYELTKYLPIFYGYIIGYISHLLLDLSTRGGLPLFLPFSNKKFALTRMKTGSKHELFVAILNIITVTVVVCLFLKNSDSPPLVLTLLNKFNQA